MTRTPDQESNSIKGHLDDESLLELLEPTNPAGHAADPDRFPEAQHLKRCARCRKRRSELAGVVLALRGRELKEVPRWLMAWSEDLPRTDPRPVRAPLLKLRLSFDSWQLQPAGARTAAAPALRRLVFHSGSVDVDIEIEPAAGGKSAQLRGQVLDAAVPGGRVLVSGEARLASNRKIVATALLDERGQFEFSGALPGVYSLRLSARGFNCQIPRLEI